MVVAVVALATTRVIAQRQGGVGIGFGGGPSHLALLTQGFRLADGRAAGAKSVQEDLKLSEDQVQKLQDLQKSQPQGGGRGFGNLSQKERAELQKKMEALAKANQKAIAEILKPEQAKRLEQIALQVRGTEAFADPEVARS